MEPEKYTDDMLLSAYLDKQNPVFGGFRRRFVVLTHDALHWFKVSEGVRQWELHTAIVILSLSLSLLQYDLRDSRTSISTSSGSATREDSFQLCSAVLRRRSVWHR